MKKKGISPLIATVLIIGFTVALAAVIMTWGQSFIKGMQETSEESTTAEMTCAQDVEIEATICREPQGDPSLEGDDDLVFILKNNKGVIQDVIMRITFNSAEDPAVGSMAVDMGKPSPLLDKLAILSYGGYMGPVADYSPDGTSALKQAEFVPQIAVEGNTITCTGSKAVLDFSDWNTKTEGASEIYSFKTC